jgi:hypothetical protein
LVAGVPRSNGAAKSSLVGDEVEVGSDYLVDDPEFICKLKSEYPL